MVLGNFGKAEELKKNANEYLWASKSTYTSQK